MPIHSSSPDVSVHAAYINQFYLSPQLRESLSHHHLRLWTGEYFRSRLTIHNTIISYGVEYIVVMPECSRSAFFSSPALKLSFRAPKPEFGIPPYVLVRFYRTSDGNIRNLQAKMHSPSPSGESE